MSCFDIWLVNLYQLSLESKLAFPSESSKLEGEGDFVEYVGSGKLKGKKVLVTGGEYDSPGELWRLLTIVDMILALELAARWPF